MKPSGVLLRIAGAFVALAVLYVASFGPVYGYALRWYGNPKSTDEIFRFVRVQKLYRPIFWLGEQSPALERMATSYSYGCFTWWTLWGGTRGR